MKEKEKELKKTSASASVAPLSTFHHARGNGSLYHRNSLFNEQQYGMWQAKSQDSGARKRFRRD